MADFDPEGKSRKHAAPKALWISLAVGVVIVLLGWTADTRARMDARAAVTRTQERAVNEQKYVLRSELNDLAANTSMLAQMASSRMKPSGGGRYVPDSSMREEFLNFGKSRRVFEQIRLIGPDGAELVNIKRIRARSGTYYFRDTTAERPKDLSQESWAPELFSLQAGKVAFLGMGLKTDEDGRVEEPRVPILRIGAAVAAGESVKPVGYVLLDYVASGLFERMEKLDRHLGTETLITNSEGFWLRGPAPSDEWGFLYPQRSGNTLAVSHPAVWKQLTQHLAGMYSDENGLVTFDSIASGAVEGVPVVFGQQPMWKILNWQAPDFIAQKEFEAVKVIWWAVGLALLLFMPLTHLIVTTRDQQREAARSRERTRALLQSIADCCVDGIIAGEAVRDPQGDIMDFRLVFSNPAAGHMLKAFDRAGTEPSDRREFPLFFSSDFFAHCVEVVVLGERYETELSTENGDLGKRWFRMIVVKLDDGIVMTFSDISHQKLAVNELRHAKEVAEVANRAKGQFLTMMGHEIRTPMNGLLGFASLLEKTDLSDEQKEYLATLRLSGEALLRILEDILDYSRLEYETLQIKSVPVDIKEVVTQVSQLFVMALGDRNLELVTKFDADIPGQLLADDVRLRQILVNLVGNAIKFTEEGFILIKAVRETLEGREYVVFHVVDSGPGVSPDMIDRLFKPFSQVDSTITRRFGGTGLGLSICKRLVETMGGEIGVNTAPGKGSDFYFSLPVRIPEFPGRQVLPARRLLAGISSSLRILVVDDDPVNRKLICRMIEKIGAKPELAESGSQAVRAFKENEFDLILMDMQMPGMDGLETTRRIRAIEAESGLRQRTPISALTANSADRDRELCFEAGMDDFLSKPVRIDDLERLIEKNTA